MTSRRSSRPDGRRADELRDLIFTPDFVRSADGSCLMQLGGTRVICTASITPGVSKWREGLGLGWVTAEYAMLPASTGRRKERPGIDRDSRAVEIQRLIGRVMRGVVRFEKLGENTITLDCDVLEADGGTRCCAITGAQVALARAIRKGESEKRFARGALSGSVAAVSVVLSGGRALLDPCYLEDASADVDLNLAVTDGGKIVELQASAEGAAFDDKQLSAMLRLGRRGIRQLLAGQKSALKKRIKR